jgi:uncharacterized protein YdhG (YjbR/CyaY superfamily)
MSDSEEVDRYISNFPASTRDVLSAVRAQIVAVAPDAEEGMSYGMPAYKLNGKPLVYFAGYDHHVGFYATPHGHKRFESELSRYKQGKGSVQFPLSEPMPLDLIQRITQFKVNLLTEGVER